MRWIATTSENYINAKMIGSIYARKSHTDRDEIYEVVAEILTGSTAVIARFGDPIEAGNYIYNLVQTLQ